MKIAKPQDILDFWFGPKPGAFRQEWFKKDSAFDQEIKTRFWETHRAAVAGQLEEWKKTPEGLLAFIILLDQFSRNMFRGQARAFASDALALKAAIEGVRKGFDRQVLPVQRSFYYLPYEHSEKLVHQKASVKLFRDLDRNTGKADLLTYALKHQEIIKKFGRFPHRNSVLGRKSTPTEEKFIAKVAAF